MPVVSRKTFKLSLARELCLVVVLKLLLLGLLWWGFFADRTQAYLSDETVAQGLLDRVSASTPSSNALGNPATKEPSHHALR